MEIRLIRLVEGHNGLVGRTQEGKICIFRGPAPRISFPAEGWEVEVLREERNYLLVRPLNRVEPEIYRPGSDEKIIAEYGDYVLVKVRTAALLKNIFHWGIPPYVYADSRMKPLSLKGDEKYGRHYFALRCRPGSAAAARRLAWEKAKMDEEQHKREAEEAERLALEEAEEALREFRREFPEIARLLDFSAQDVMLNRAGVLERGNKVIAELESSFNSCFNQTVDELAATGMERAILLEFWRDHREDQQAIQEAKGDYKAFWNIVYWK